MTWTCPQVVELGWSERPASKPLKRRHGVRLAVRLSDGRVYTTLWSEPPTDNATAVWLINRTLQCGCELHSRGRWRLENPVPF